MDAGMDTAAGMQGFVGGNSRHKAKTRHAGRVGDGYANDLFIYFAAHIATPSLDQPAVFRLSISYFQGLNL